MVTVEAAIALGGLVLVLAVVLAGIGAAVARIRCVDAAGEGARRASRDDVAGAQALARDLPAGTEVVVTPTGDTVRVLVRVPALGGALPGLRISAEAVAAREPVVAAPTGEPDDGAPVEVPAIPEADEPVPRPAATPEELPP